MMNPLSRRIRARLADRSRSRDGRHWVGQRLEALEGRVLLDGAMDLMRIENQRVLNLVPDSSFQAISIQSGKWDDVATWKDKHVPLDGDNVLISDKTEVTITNDEAITTDASGIAARRAVHMLRVDGTLSFDTSTADATHPALRRLLVDTLIVSPMNTMNKDGTPFYNNDDSMSGGVFNMGTSDQARIPAGVKAVVVFADNGAVANTDLTKPDHNNPDPYQLGRGLIAMNTVRIFGRTVTSDATLAPTTTEGGTLVGPAANKNKPVTTITLESIPSDWSVGDRLIVTGNTADNGHNTNQDEQVAIAAINANTITLSDPTNPNFTGLIYNHTAPTGARVYIGDVTRNANFQSENVLNVAKRGHIMFMHTLDVQVDAAGFYGLGRTDKRSPLDDANPVQDYDTNGNLIPGAVTDDVLDTKNPALKSNGYRVMVPALDANGNPVLDAKGNPVLVIARSGQDQRARYAVHFHHASPVDMIAMGMKGPFMADTINDSAVVDSPGWGIVNHSSDVDITNNIVFNAVGAGFATEAGDEVGSFVGNIAIHEQGSGDGIESRQQFQDFGHEGDGFWFQGGNVDVVNNIATGARHSGFVFFPVGLVQKGVTTTINASDLGDAPWAKGYKNGVVPVGDVPLKSFVGNTAYGVSDGFESWFNLLNVSDTDPRRDVLSHFTAYSTGGTGVFTPYSNNITFDHVRLLGNGGGTGFARNDVTRNAVYNDVSALGFSIGINVPVNGLNTVQGGTFSDVKAIYISTARTDDRVVNINDGSDIKGNAVPINFIHWTSTGTTPPPTQYDIFLQTNYNPKERDLTTFFNPDVIKLATVKINGAQVYYNEQASDFVPFSTADPKNPPPSYVPTALIGQTNSALYSAYGLAIGGVVAPKDAHTVPYVNGLVGTASSYLPDVTLVSKKYTQFNQNLVDANGNDYSKVKGYFLSFKYDDPSNLGKFITVDESKGKTPQASPIVQGWNLLTRTVTINGTDYTRTLLVYGDDIAPDFVPAKVVPWVINRADFDNNATWTLEGQITDDSFGERFFRKNFALGDKHFFSDLWVDKTSAKTYTTFTMTFTDFAGNKKIWTKDLEVNDTAALQKDLGRKNLPNITPSETLIALIDADPLIPPKKK